MSVGSTTGTLALREVQIKADKVIELPLKVWPEVGFPGSIASLPKENHHLRRPSVAKFHGAFDRDHLLVRPDGLFGKDRTGSKLVMGYW